MRPKQALDRSGNLQGAAWDKKARGCSDVGSKAADGVSEFGTPHNDVLEPTMMICPQKTMFSTLFAW